ncbi:PREDICTED: acid phosphatase 1-like [Nicotiana attenuata]|uniref:acid phosphatase 1-like n=1 Tax=Nicotiana attenuata TaxID=49451 RepID=UPI00090584BB|nr:PREDICTED: acid phosphatase 1-like [Nicotiana attenuata]
MRILRICSFLILFSFAFGHENLNTLIVEFPENTEPQLKETITDVELECTSWRFAVEANNLSPWKTIPKECADYVRQYINGGAYKLDIDRVSSEAGAYAESMKLGADGKDVWDFDVDETLLSNLPYYSQHGYGLEVFDSVKFDEWVEKGVTPAIGSSLKFYQDVMRLGFKVFLLTGRSERHRIVTVENLMNAGFQDWDKLILRGSEDHGKSATIYKSEKRDEVVEEGFRIAGNSGDQWSDLLGSSASIRSFKLPNPMYYIP